MCWRQFNIKSIRFLHCDLLLIKIAAALTVDDGTDVGDVRNASLWTLVDGSDDVLEEILLGERRWAARNWLILTLDLSRNTVQPMRLAVANSVLYTGLLAYAAPMPLDNVKVLRILRGMSPCVLA